MKRKDKYKDMTDAERMCLLRKYTDMAFIQSVIASAIALLAFLISL